MADENNEQNQSPVDLSGLVGALDLTPAWAKGKADDKSRYARFEGRAERDDRARAPRSAGGGFGGSRRDDRGSRPSFSKFGEGRPGGDRGDRGRDRGPRREGFNGPRNDAAGAPRRDSFAGPRDGGRRFDRPVREFVKPLDVDVRILPNQKTLGRVIKTIQETHCAYPLKQLAYMFLDHPGSCTLRVSAKKESTETLTFHQCKACGFVTLSEDELLTHVLTTHLCDYYDVEQVECEAPTGSFSCVARCGLSGALLGPSNLHGYDARVREMIRTRYPQMSEAVYRRHIEMVRDPEIVEQWRQSATKKTIYRRKGMAEAPAVEREAAELEFRLSIAPGLLSAPKSVDMTADVALKSPAKGLVFACRDALTRESRFPASLFYALRGAFHRKLQFFRANEARGPEFVTAVPMKTDPVNLVDVLADVVKFVGEHPFVTPTEAVQMMAGDDAKKASDVRAAISNLIEMGRLVQFSPEYCGGILATATEHPKYRPPRRSPNEAKPAGIVSAAKAVTTAEAKPAEETPAAAVSAPVASPTESAPAEVKTADEAPEAVASAPVANTPEAASEEKKEEVK